MQNNEVLVAYATKAGSTQGVAEAIADTLREYGIRADLHPVSAIKNLNTYRAAVIGSAIRGGSWLPEATAFVQTHRAALERMPLALFTVCLTLQEDTPGNRAIVSAYLDPVRAVVTPQAEECFAGMHDPRKLSLPFRAILRAMKAPKGDFRDWDAIQTWASSLPPVLLNGRG